MIVGVDAVTGGVQRAPESCITDAMLGAPMSDLHDRARAPFRLPSSPEQTLAVVSMKFEFARRHSPPFRAALRPYALRPGAFRAARQHGQARRPAPRLTQRHA